jgi:hypothetical protein
VPKIVDLFLSKRNNIELIWCWLYMIRGGINL